MKKFTETEIGWYRAYEKVRQGGKWNMFDARARRATGLDSDAYQFVLKNYTALRTESLKGKP